jgi:hypothetical protein
MALVVTRCLIPAEGWIRERVFNEYAEEVPVEFADARHYGEGRVSSTSTLHTCLPAIVHLHMYLYRTEPNWFAQKQIIVLKAVVHCDNTSST